MRAALYLRVSTDEQAREGLSLAMQEEACRRAALAAGAASVEVFRDEGYSGTTLARPALRSLLSRLADFDALFVYRMDRLCRRLRDRLALLDALIEAGISIHSTTEHVDLDTIMGRAMVQIMAVMAEVEVETLRERVRDAMRHRTETLGLSHGKPPFGYRRLSPREPLEIEPNEAPIVLSIFRAYAAGDSLGAIARRLTAAGIPTAQGRPVWHISELRVILRNRAYRGEVPHRGNYYPGHHPALVPARLWQQAQDRLASARRLGAPRTPRSLGVLLRCAICGAPMRRGQFHETRRPAPRYDCREREHFTGDQRHPPNSVGADKAEAAIWLYTEWLLERGGFREGLELYLTRLAKERASGEAARARERLRQIDAQLSRALRGYSLGNLPEDIYLREIEPLQAERTHLQAQLDAVQVPPDLRELAGYLRHLQPATYIRNLRRQPVHVQAAFLGRLFERIDVRGNLLTFYHRAVPLPPWEMTLPRRWSSKQDSGAFTLPDGTVTTGRPPRH